jgi:hypothetical protein
MDAMEEQLVESSGYPIGHHPRTALHNRIQPLDYLARRDRSGISILPVGEHVYPQNSGHTAFIFATGHDEEEKKFEDQELDAVLHLRRKGRERLQEHQALPIGRPPGRQNLGELDCLGGFARGVVVAMWGGQ